jgi:biopolymer transport protein ExbD
MLLQRSRIAVLARHRARIEIIPLIDVIFFLLATFVLFTLALNRIQSLPVVLPQSGKAEDNPDLVTIQVSDSGAIYWNREPIGPAEVPARLAHYKTQTESPRVVVTGDEKAKFGPLVTVLDQVRQAGITAFSVETKPRPTGK